MFTEIIIQITGTNPKQYGERVWMKLLHRHLVPFVKNVFAGGTEDGNCRMAGLSFSSSWLWLFFRRAGLMMWSFRSMRPLRWLRPPGGGSPWRLLQPAVAAVGDQSRWRRRWTAARCPAERASQSSGSCSGCNCPGLLLKKEKTITIKVKDEIT